jgi:hypothetical protein
MSSYVPYRHPVLFLNILNLQFVESMDVKHANMEDEWNTNNIALQRSKRGLKL